MLSCAEPRTIQAVLSCGTKNSSSVARAMEHFETLYPTAGAEGRAKSILRRVGDCVSGHAEAGEFEAEDPKLKPWGIPLVSLSTGEDWGVLGARGRPRGPLLVPRQGCDGHGSGRVSPDVQPNRAVSWTVGVHARGRPWAEKRNEAEDLDSGTAVRVQRISSMKAPQGVHECCLRDARDTRCLLGCPCRPPCLFCWLQ